MRLDSSKMDGKRTCGSVVSQQRKASMGLRPLTSFSRRGSQLITRCRFLRQTQSPLSAAVFSRA